MRTVEATHLCPASAEELWPFLAVPARWSQWLTIHKAWKSEPPAEASPGLTLTASATVMNMPVAIDWTFEKVDAPHTLALSGITRADVKLDLTITLSSGEDGTRVNVTTHIDGGMIDGPLGAVFKNALEGAMRRSLKKLDELTR